VLDIPEIKLKTGISHRYPRPTQATVDPPNNIRQEKRINVWRVLTTA
jgi:hypothetical protein